MGEMKVVVFRIGEQNFAADIRDVQEVIRAPAVSPLPHPTPPILGVFNLRGHIVTALDGNAALGIPPSADARARMVIFHQGDRTLGLLVDDASQVLTIDEGGVRPSTEAFTSAASRGILIHDGAPIVLLDTQFLFAHKPVTIPRTSP